MSQKKQVFSDKAIRLMSYETRLAKYNQEKDELFRTYTGVSASELQKAHDELIRKWRI